MKSQTLFPKESKLFNYLDNCDNYGVSDVLFNVKTCFKKFRNH
jgi:hypothetical protein